MIIRIEEVLFVCGLVALIYQWRLNVASKRRKSEMGIRGWPDEQLEKAYDEYDLICAYPHSDSDEIVFSEITEEMKRRGNEI